MDLDFDIVVVANNFRKPLILPFLQNIPHQISYTFEYTLPQNWKPLSEYQNYVRHMRGHLGQHRCLEGHKDALRMATKDIILVIEDDAVPNRTDWLDFVININPFDFLYVLGFEILSIHGREVRYEHFQKIPFKFPDGKREFTACIPFDNTASARWVLGSLAYFIKKEDREKIYAHNYNGLPMDLFLCKKFNFCLIEPSPLDHDRSEGSLIDFGVGKRIYTV